MKLDKNTKILIIGLGVIGGGYASALTEKGYEVMLRNACMGYEAANHYYYNRTALMEKIINCLPIRKAFFKMDVIYLVSC